jgi:RNA polymerase sigma-70 factor, ECF subfamily
MKLHAGLARVFSEKPSRLVRYGLINGLPGFVTFEDDDKLRHLVDDA